MEKLKSKIPVLKRNAKGARRRSREPLALGDLDPNLANAPPPPPPGRADGTRQSLRRSASVSVLDLRFVAVRRRDDSQPRFRVFRDHDTENHVAPSTLPKGVKNVKRSLTRPHSRQLQLASVSKRLAFTEEAPADGSRSRCSSPRLEAASSDSSGDRVYEIDVFTYLMEKEERTPLPAFLKSVKYRAFVLNWLTDTNGAGDPAVVQTAAWYFDTLLSRLPVESRDLTIVIMACYWIAKKIHGAACTARAVVRRAGGVFREEHLCAAEKKIVALLNFPCQAVLPQEFLRYLASCCDSGGEQETLLCATFICVNAINLNLDMCREYPSVVAAAAIRTSLLLLEKQPLVEKLKGCFVYQAAVLKGDVTEVCVAQIEALRVHFADAFELTAAQRLLGERGDVLPRLRRQLRYLYSTGGEGIVRAFLMA